MWDADEAVDLDCRLPQLHGCTGSENGVAEWLKLAVDGQPNGQQALAPRWLEPVSHVNAGGDCHQAAHRRCRCTVKHTHLI